MTHELQTWHWVVTFWTNFCQNHPKTIIPRWLRLRLPRSRGHVSTCPWGTQTIFQSTHASNSQLGLGYKAWYILIPFCSHQNITIGYRICFFLDFHPQLTNWWNMMKRYHQRAQLPHLCQGRVAEASSSPANPCLRWSPWIGSSVNPTSETVVEKEVSWRCEPSISSMGMGKDGDKISRQGTPNSVGGVQG